MCVRDFIINFVAYGYHVYKDTAAVTVDGLQCIKRLVSYNHILLTTTIQCYCEGQLAINLSYIYKNEAAFFNM